MKRAKTTQAPAWLVQEVAALIDRGERSGHRLPSRPEIRLGGSSRATSARPGQPALITIDSEMLQRSIADLRWVIAHELSHLLPTTQRPGSVLQRVLIAGGLAVLAVTLLGFLIVAVPRGWATVPAGPAWGWFAAGMVIALLMALVGQMQYSRHLELAADRAAAVVYGQTMSVEHVAWIRQREGLGNRLLPLALRTHPRPERRRSDVQAAVDSCRDS